MSVEKLYKAVTPLWDPKMGERLATARMEKFLTQAQLGALLGISQRAVATIERGRVSRAEFSLSRLQAALGDRLFFVLWGAGKSKHDPGKAWGEYWKHVQSKQGPERKPGERAEEIYPEKRKPSRI